MSDGGSAVVSALGYERSGPAFQIPTTAVLFLFHDTKIRRKCSSTPAATSTPVRRTYLGISVGLHILQPATTTITAYFHLKLLTPTWSTAKSVTVIALSRLRSLLIYDCGNLDLPLQRTRNGPSFFSKASTPHRRPMQAGDRIRRRWPSQEWCGHCKVHGHHHQHVILTRGTEAYDRTRNAQHRADRYPPPHRRLPATSTRVWQQMADALPHIEERYSYHW